MRLRPTLIGLLLVLTLVLSSTVYAGFALHKNGVVDTQRSDVNETAERTARTLESRLAANERVVRVGASAHALGEHGTDRQQTALTAFLRKSEFDGASVVARNGTVSAFTAVGANASGSDGVVGSDFSDRAYVKAALNGSTYVSEPFQASSGNYVVVVSAPIRNGTEIVGTLNAAFHLDSSAPHLATSASGLPALFADLDDLAAPMQTVSVERGNEMLYGDGHVDGNTFDATEAVAGTDWVVVVREDRSQVQNRLENVTLVQGGALLVVLFSVATVGFWTYRTNIEQIAELRAGLTALEGGEYDVDVALTGTEEWDEIGDRFERVGNRLEQRESQLRVLNRVLRHNLRNEMNVVLGHSQTVTDDDADVDAHAAAIESAARETLAISQHARMIEDRLKDATGTREPASIDAVVDDALATVTQTELATVTVDVPSDVVVADGDALRTALAEVVANAIVHNPAPPGDCEVSVTATDQDATVRVTVTDNGPGLPDIERDLLTGELEASPVDHSEGLGLWIARWLVERADGRIDATVTDDGTTLTLYVPTVYTSD